VFCFPAVLLHVVWLFFLPYAIRGELQRYGPPRCEQTHVADGVQTYEDLARMYFPDDVVNTGGVNYRFALEQKFQQNINT
jgi:hypothetical protein